MPLTGLGQMKCKSEHTKVLETMHSRVNKDRVAVRLISDQIHFVCYTVLGGLITLYHWYSLLYRHVTNRTSKHDTGSHV